MRQIKFRAKTTANGHWVYGSLIDYGDNTFAIRNSKSQPWVQADTIGQFTGLHDRNGKEIYEGDILRGALHNHVVKFKNGIFFAEVEDEYGYDCIKPTLFKATEVIGNIHEQSKS